MALFKRAALFTDLHMGKKNDSELHNRDCLSYIDWFVNMVNDDGSVDCIIFLGDWFDNQIRIRMDTFAHYSQMCLERLDSLGIPVYIIVGNHDMFHKRTRDVHSTSLIRGFENLLVINDLIEIDDCLMVPYMVGSEANIPPNSKAKYVFGHLELPTFLTNATHEFSGHTGIVMDDFIHPDAVFSGHFHKRQMKKNDRDIPIWYIGNAFPHDYNDANDRDRGMMFLNWGGEPEFVNWPDMPTYNRIKTSTLLEYIEDDTFSRMFNEKSDIQIIDDVGLTIDDADDLRDALSSVVRRITFMNLKSDDDDDIDTDDSDFGAVDIVDVFVGYLQEMDTNGSDLDKTMMVDILKGNFDFDAYVGGVNV